MRIFQIEEQYFLMTEEKIIVIIFKKKIILQNWIWDEQDSLNQTRSRWI